MGRSHVTVAAAMLLLLAAPALAEKEGRKLKQLDAGGITTQLPFAIPSLPTGSILPLGDVASIAHLPAVQPVLNLVGGLLGSLGLGGLGAISTPQIGPLAPIGVDLSNILSQTTPPQPAPGTPKNGTFLYMWCGYGRTYTDPVISTETDFLAVGDLNKGSPTYGHVIHVEKIGTIGNEPHHIGTSFDRKTILGSGLLSFLKLQDDIFQFDLKEDIRKPRYVKSINPDKTAVSDHVLGIAPGIHPQLPDGGFFITQMGSDIGGSPGGISLYNPDLVIVDQYPKGPASDYPDLDPHGSAVNLKYNQLVTADFILPVSTVTANLFTFPGLDLLANPDITPLGKIVGRNSVRVWDFDTVKLSKTIRLPGTAGVMDVKYIGDTDLVYATDVLNNSLWVVNTTAGLPQKVLQFPDETHPHLLAEDPNHKGTRFFVSLNLAGKVLYLDTTNPFQPKVLSVLDLGSKARPHYVTPVGPGDNRVAIADYFLDQGAIGVIHDIGNRKVIVVEVANDKFVTDTAVQFFFENTPARPHGILSSTQSIDLVY